MMKQPTLVLFIFLLSGLVLTACQGQVTFDATSKATIQTSTKEMGETQPVEDRAEFAKA